MVVSFTVDFFLSIVGINGKEQDLIGHVTILGQSRSLSTRV